MIIKIINIANVGIGKEWAGQRSGCQGLAWSGIGAAHAWDGQGLRWPGAKIVRDWNGQGLEWSVMMMVRNWGGHG